MLNIVTIFASVHIQNMHTKNCLLRGNFALDTIVTRDYPQGFVIGSRNPFTETIVTPNITAGTVLVGAFKQGATVVTKAGEGARIEVHTGDHDDAIYNRVTVVVEERLALAVRYPKAFVKITEAAS